MRKSYFALMLGIAALFFGTVLAAFDLVKGSRTAEIVLGKNADSSSRLAAKELSEYDRQDAACKNGTIISHCKNLYRYIGYREKYSA